jgi:Ca-activated chloride channel family protein
MFARPGVLWLLFLLPAFGLLAAYARWARRRALRQLGHRFRVAGLVQVRRGRRWLAELCVGFAVAFVILGLAGPRWGQERVETKPPHQDLVVVLDVSRSMTAEQPSRLERALRALENLSATYRKRGEVRIGLVLTAAYARLQLPPSQDYDHFELLLQRVRARDIPPELWVQADRKAVSGTRLGAGLARAVSLKRPEQTRSFAILLVSDGDDPLPDEEWIEGVQAARAKHIPIDVLAVGDPDGPAAVPADDKDDKKPPVFSKLNEAVLQEIARRTEGVYIPAYTQTQIPLASLKREIDDARRAADALHDPATDEPDLFQPTPRHAWFYLAAFVLFMLALLINEAKTIMNPKESAMSGSPGDRAAGGLSPRVNGQQPGPRGLSAGVVLLALALVSAAPLAAVDDRIRAGNDAFTRSEFKQALDLYTEAENCTLDPGLVAFNKAAALYELKQFKEAAEHYRRCLADDAALPERRRKAWYDLGTALLAASSGTDRELLRQAVDAFRSGLELTPDAGNLRDDTRYNLELAQRLWLQARIHGKDDETGGGDKEPKEGLKDDVKKGDGAKTAKPDKGDKKGPDKIEGTETDKVKGKDKKSMPGGRLVLPDAEELKTLSAAAMQDLLRLQVDRIAKQRLSERMAASKSLGDAPNR